MGTEVEEIFLVPFGTPDRRFDITVAVESVLLGIGDDFFDCLDSAYFVFHDSATANCFPGQLELRFNQSKNLDCGTLKKLQDRRYNQGQRDKGGVDYAQIDLLVNVVSM